MVEVLATDAFKQWYDGLDEAGTNVVFRLVEMLELLGLALGYPYSSAIEGSRYAIRELRSQSRRQPVRIFYAFDPKRQAVLLLGGDKSGDKKFYERMIPAAERMWEQYLKETKQR